MSQQPIPTSAIARHLFCARALAYDAVFPPKTRRFPFVAILVAVALVIPIWLLIPNQRLMIGAIVAGGILLGIGYLLLRVLRQARGVMVYQNVRARRNRKVMTAFNEIIGTPDYLVHTPDSIIPVLVKNNPAPQAAHYAHVMQVIAYCLLVSENMPKRPTFGVIRYGDGRTFEVDFDEDAVEELVAIFDDIDRNQRAADVPRSHQDRQRCYACSHRNRCDQSLF